MCVQREEKSDSVGSTSNLLILSLYLQFSANQNSTENCLLYLPWLALFLKKKHVRRFMYPLGLPPTQ